MKLHYLIVPLLLISGRVFAQPTPCEVFPADFDIFRAHFELSSLNDDIQWDGSRLSQIADEMPDAHGGRRNQLLAEREKLENEERHLILKRNDLADDIHGYEWNDCANRKANAPARQLPQVTHSAVNSPPAIGAAAFNITLKNECSAGGIYVAVSYLGTDGTWRAEGWWRIEPGQIANTILRSNNGTFYLYGESVASGNLVWNGSNQQGSINVVVVQDRFAYSIAHDSPAGANPRSISMFAVTANGQNYVHSFTCPGVR